jgi:hypothetical protein
MLTTAAIGGFFIPIIFGHIVPLTSYNTGWVLLGVLSFGFALVGLAGRNPTTAWNGTYSGTAEATELLDAERAS